MLYLPPRPYLFLSALLSAVAMGQYWKILNIDRQEQLRNKAGLKLWEIVHNDTAQQLVPLLARPTFFQCKVLSDQESADAAHSATTRKGLTSNIGRFGKLPNELFIILTGFLTDFDALFLGLTCRIMWLTLQTRIQEALIAYTAPWSGDRILTVGDYAGTYPPNMLTEAEKTQLGLNSLDDDEAVDNDEDQSPATVSLYRLGRDDYAEARPNETRPNNLSFLEVGLDPLDAALLRALIRPLFDFVHDEGGYVLRNLSKHEYVRGNALVELGGSTTKSQQPFIQPVGFGELIALRTQWTDDPSGTMGPMKGDWAGDRFDIVLLKTLERERKDGTWKDVSKDEVNMLREVMYEKLEGYW